MEAAQRLVRLTRPRIVDAQVVERHGLERTVGCRHVQRMLQVRVGALDAEARRADLHKELSSTQPAAVQSEQVFGRLHRARGKASKHKGVADAKSAEIESKKRSRAASERSAAASAKSSSRAQLSQANDAIAIVRKQIEMMQKQAVT